MRQRQERRNTSGADVHLRPEDRSTSAEGLPLPRTAPRGNMAPTEVASRAVFGSLVTSTPFARARRHKLRTTPISVTDRMKNPNGNWDQKPFGVPLRSTQN